jgi:hypothetical protein
MMYIQVFAWALVTLENIHGVLNTEFLLIVN